MARISGGDVRSGIVGGFTEGALGVHIAEVTQKSRGAGVALAGFVSGAVSEVTGGKFAVGASTGAMGYLFNQMSGKNSQERHVATDTDPVMRVLKTLVAYGRMAAGGLQVVAGKGMCATAVLCSIGAPLAAQGIGNVGGGISDYLGVLGYRTDFNVTQRAYEALSSGNGENIFASVDVATGVAGLAAGLRQVPVAIDRGMTVTQYTTVSAYRVEGTTAPAIMNDILQAANSANRLTE